MRDKLRELSIITLLILSFLLLSTAIDTVGEVPKYMSLPRPPFMNQTGGYKPNGTGGSPINWDISTSLEKNQIIEMDANCGCEDIPLFNITGITGTPYIRVKLGESYSGKWTMYNSSGEPYNGESIPSNTGGEPRKIYVHPYSPITSYLPVTENPYQLIGATLLDYFPEKVIFKTRNQVQNEYSVSYSIKTHDIDELVDASLAYDAKYLLVPYEIQIEIENMTKAIVGDIESEYLKIKAIETFLKNNYSYNLNYTAPPESVDPIIWFIFENREGVCIHYNTALVLMARSINMPMRLVTGFAVNPTVHKQIVQPYQAHAWAEAQFKDLGWVSFDATGRSLDFEQTQTTGLIQTKTTILSQDQSCYKGYNFSISGAVTDQYGSSVNGLTTLVYLKEDKTQDGVLCGKTTQTNDWFTVDCTIPLNIIPGEYNVEAITTGNAHYNWSSSDPPIDILAISYIDHNISNRVIARRWTLIEGRLMETETRIPINIHDLNVIIESPSYESDFLRIQEVHAIATTDEGRFLFNHKFEPGRSKIILYWEGTFYYRESLETLNITAIPLTIIPTPLNALARGEPVWISGKVQAENLIPEKGEPVEIYLNEGYIGTASTNDDGFFNYSYLITPSAPTSDIEIGYRLIDDPNTIYQSSVIAIRPTLNYLIRNVNTWKTPFQIEAVIQTDHGSPMVNVELELISENNNQILSTDENGRVIFEISLNSRLMDDEYNFQIKYKGTKFILPVTITDTIQLNPVINYLGLLIGLLTISSIFGLGYGVYTILRRRFPSVPEIPVLNVISKKVENKENEIELGVFIIKNNHATIKVKINEIKENLPLVWGISEPFTLIVEINSSIEINNEILIEGLEDKNISKYIASGQTSRSITTVFHEKGYKKIIFSYQDNDKGINAETLLIMRIVDYREEIVNQFNQDFRTQMQENDELSEQITAREMIQRLALNKEPQSLNFLKVMVHNFEEATYSQHPITVKNYWDYMESRYNLEVEKIAG